MKKLLKKLWKLIARICIVIGCVVAGIISFLVSIITSLLGFVLLIAAAPFALIGGLIALPWMWVQRRKANGDLTVEAVLMPEPFMT